MSGIRVLCVLLFSLSLIRLITNDEHTCYLSSIYNLLHIKTVFSDFFFQTPEVGVYCMSKAAMDMFTQCLALGMAFTATIAHNCLFFYNKIKFNKPNLMDISNCKSKIKPFDIRYSIYAINENHKRNKVAFDICHNQTKRPLHLQDMGKTIFNIHVNIESITPQLFTEIHVSPLRL